MTQKRSENTNYHAMRRIGKLINFIYRLGYIVRFFHSIFYSLKCRLNTLRGLEAVTRIVWSDNEILNSSAVALSRMIRNRQVTSELVVQTFIDRIRQVDPIINAVVSDNYHQAIKRAKQVRCYVIISYNGTCSNDHLSDLLYAPCVQMTSILDYNVKSLPTKPGLLYRLYCI